MITQVKSVSIPVSDQDLALEFYVKKLGFELIVDAPMEGGQQRWIELRIPGSDTQVVLFTQDGLENRVGTPSNIIFSSSNVEKSYQELKNRGVSFLKPPQKEHWGKYALFCDPDQNVFCLSESDDSNEYGS